MNLNQSIERMTDCICVILERNVHSIWLYGSVGEADGGLPKYLLS